MSAFVEFIRVAQHSALRLCAVHWRQLIVVAAASWFIPSHASAAHAEPQAEPQLDQTLNSEPVAGPEAEAASEQAPALNTSVCAPDGLAVDGYDLVSYYVADKPLAGDEAIYAEHLGLTYRFATTKNRAAFIADPGKYLPSYRGWCSTNLSMGRLACPDYTNYKLEEGKLLFFERVGFTNGLDIWNSDPLRHRRQANQNFALLSGQ